MRHCFKLLHSIGLLLCVGCLMFSPVLKAQVSNSDSLALVELYNATNGDAWIDNTNWLNTSVEQWEGIVLTDDGINVKFIYLMYNNLSGTLPNLNLPLLEEIVLIGNQLTGTVPSFENLTNLKELIINENQLSGTIPNFVLPNLIKLNLGANQLVGNLPDFSSLPQLEELYVNTNQLSGTVPDLTGLTTLFALSIANNQFTFDGIEDNAAFFEQSTVTNFFYAPQDTITIEKNCELTVEAGGTLANNTYRWYKNDATNLVLEQTGDSTFEPTESGIYFCEITNSTATDLTLSTYNIEFELEDFVRSGDTNGDGEVNHYDLKNIGLAYGAIGAARMDTSIDFNEKCVEDWNICIQEENNCIDYKNIDANGNGEVEEGDLDAIRLNFGIGNNLGTEVTTIVDEIDAPIPISSPDVINDSLCIEVADSINMDEPIVFGIYWGSEQAQIDSVYSVAFTLEIELIDDESIIDSSAIETPILDISDSFLGDDLLEINKCFELGEGMAEWHIALTRTDQQSIVGSGLLAKAECFVPVVLVEGKSFFSGEKCIPLKFEFSDVRGIRKDGSVIADIKKATAKTVLVKKYKPTSIFDPIVDKPTFTLFPNPARDMATLNSNNAVPTTVAIYDIKGQLIRYYEKVLNYPFRINTSDLEAGMYFIEIKADEYRIVKDLVVIK